MIDIVQLFTAAKAGKQAPLLSGTRDAEIINVICLALRHGRSNAFF